MKLLSVAFIALFLPNGITPADSGQDRTQRPLIRITGGKTESLKAAFNDHHDKVRLLLILSPS